MPSRCSNRVTDPNVVAPFGYVDTTVQVYTYSWARGEPGHDSTSWINKTMSFYEQTVGVWPGTIPSRLFKSITVDGKTDDGATETMHLKRTLTRSGLNYRTLASFTADYKNREGSREPGE
jgi:hypothetical protein